VAGAKRLAAGLLGHAASLYGDAFKEAQEVQAQIADIVIEIYASESGIARAEKIAARKDRRADLAADMARVYTSDASDRIAGASRQVVAALTTAGADPSIAAAISGLTASPPLDAIAARRRIADAVVHAGKHPF
jgi:alkylation response protein AidB-like acyl-CoA dehydrogenase